jgi:cysteine desulfuration protein SufE
VPDALERLLEDFEVLDDWEERYRHVIELGRGLPPFPEAERTAANKVSGCASQVWLHDWAEAGPEGPVLRLQGDSDALIVKGLVAIALMIFDGRKLAEVAALDARAIFDRLGLSEHLTPQRANGLLAMVARIKADALHLQSA